VISAFYAKARYIDFLIHTRSEQKTATHDQPTQQVIPALQGTPPPDAPQFIQIQLPASNAELVTINLLQQTSFGIEYIYNTPVVEKLRRIAEKKWYEII